MADGPDYHKLFTDMQALNAETNLTEIVNYLRFSKGGDAHYQAYLSHYLPMLPKEQFNEFIGDVENKNVAKELNKRFEVKKEDVIEEEVSEVPQVVEEKPKKKPGRKPKNF